MTRFLSALEEKLWTGAIPFLIFIHQPLFLIEFSLDSKGLW